ncbi:MAG: triose-phosphate isomerase [Patescibacteria group bacterium]
MNRRSMPLIVANWKMQLGIEESHQRLTDLKQRLKTVRGRYQTVVCPSFVALSGMKKFLRGSAIQLGAQDVFWDDRGAYTGEVSPLNLREAGVEYVLIGHSERRQLVGETDEMVGRKVVSALGHGLTPILCVGETAHQRNDGRHELIVTRQLTAALRTAPPSSGQGRLYVAYEPVWAIGTGEPAGVEVAQTMREVIRQTLIELYSPAQVDQSFRFLYGGSVDADNVSQYVNAAAYHGALVGTASLDPEKFAMLISHITKEFNA